ncbi:hypothetical protein AB0H76_11355 [Nocardia sp. NPDC050712]|uniref:hypothetical protein n=1 Tax=Nocardia sp. NPDC050712 TaxID=3155518 RepID=UPI0033FFD279
MTEPADPDLTVTVNGKQHRLRTPVSIAGFLHSAGYSADSVSVAVSGRFVRHEDWHGYALTEGLKLSAISLTPRLSTNTAPDPWTLGDVQLESRLMLAIPEGADLTYLPAIAQASGLESVTIRTTLDEPGELADVMELLRDQGVHVLPNTAGCVDARAAIAAARHGAEIVGAPRVHLIMGEDRREIISAAEQLIGDGFYVYPLVGADPDLAAELADLGCAGIVPQADPRRFESVLDRVEVPVIGGGAIDSVAQACQAMEMGCAAVASAQVVFDAPDRVAAAKALAQAVAAGRAAYLAGRS